MKGYLTHLHSKYLLITVRERNQYLIAYDIPGLLQTMYYFSLHYFVRNPNLYFIINK